MVIAWIKCVYDREAPMSKEEKRGTSSEKPNGFVASGQNVRLGRGPIGCRYEVGSTVMFEGERFRVIGRTFDNKHNCSLYILTNDATLELPSGGLSERWQATHFEKIRIVPFNSETLVAANSELSRRPRGCRYEVGAPVMFDGVRFRVIDKIYDDKRNCTSYVITNDAALKLPSAGLTDAWLASHAEQINIVPADSDFLVAAGGGRTRRRINRKRKTRKHNLRK